MTVVACYSFSRAVSPMGRERRVMRYIGWCSVLALCVTLASRCRLVTSLVRSSTSATWRKNGCIDHYHGHPHKRTPYVTLHATRCFACLCVAFLPPIVPQEVINTFTLCSHAVARYAMPMQLIVVRDPGGRPMRRISRFRSRSDMRGRSNAARASYAFARTNE